MKIKNKLFSGFLVVIILMLLIGFNNVLALKKVNNHINSYRLIFLPLLTSIAQVRINIDYIVRQTEEYAAGWEKEDEINEAIKKYRVILDENKKNYTWFRRGNCLRSV